MRISEQVDYGFRRIAGEVVRVDVDQLRVEADGRLIAVRSKKPGRAVLMLQTEGAEVYHAVREFYRGRGETDIRILPNGK